MAEQQQSPFRVTPLNILLGIVCVVAANLLLVWFRSFGDIPLPDMLEQALATAVGVLAWVFIAARLKR